MAGMFDADWNKVRCLSDIEAINERHASADWPNQDRYIKMRGGETFLASEHSVAALLRRPTQLVPAQPGVCLIRMGFDDGQEWEDREPLIAWAICLDGEVRPVVPHGIYNDANRAVFVEMPDGTIFGVGSDADPYKYADAAEMREHFRRLQEKANA